MKNLFFWICILSAVALAVLTNSVSTVWAKEENKLSLSLVALIVLSPFVFISFGLITTRLGLAITSGVVDSLLTLSTILIGLIFFHEWNKISSIQYLGIILATIGIFLMLFFSKNEYSTQ